VKGEPRYAHALACSAKASRTVASADCAMLDGLHMRWPLRSSDYRSTPIAVAWSLAVKPEVKLMQDCQAGLVLPAQGWVHAQAGPL
jgi:hypothetical protein